jgi:hypothetical protein
MFDFIRKLFFKSPPPPIEVVHHLNEYSLFPPDSRNRNTEVVSRKPGIEVNHGLELSDGLYRVLHIRGIEGVNHMFCAIVKKEST